MNNSFKIAIGLSAACLAAMVLFNHLAVQNAIAREAYLTYSSWAFESLKVLAGMILGSLASAFQHKKEIENYQQTIESMGAGDGSQHK